MQAWLRRQQPWLVVEPLPAYAPELNPVEPLWSSLKGVELAKLASDTLEEVIAAAEHGIQRIRRTHHPVEVPKESVLLDGKRAFPFRLYGRR
jgi:transposase